MQDDDELVIPKEEDPLIKNYLMLYQAIVFSNYDDGQEYVVAVYDTKEKYRLVAVFNNSQMCANFFHTSKEVINCNLCRDTLIKARFKTERFKCGTTSTKAEYYKIMNDRSNRKQLKYHEIYNGYKKIF